MRPSIRRPWLHIEKKKKSPREDYKAVVGAGERGGGVGYAIRDAWIELGLSAWTFDGRE